MLHYYLQAAQLIGKEASIVATPRSLVTASCCKQPCFMAEGGGITIKHPIAPPNPHRHFPEAVTETGDGHAQGSLCDATLLLVSLSIQRKTHRDQASKMPNAQGLCPSASSGPTPDAQFWDPQCSRVFYLGRHRFCSSRTSRKGAMPHVHSESETNQSQNWTRPSCTDSTTQPETFPGNKIKYLRWRHAKHILEILQVAILYTRLFTLILLFATIVTTHSQLPKKRDSCSQPGRSVSSAFRSCSLLHHQHHELQDMAAQQTWNTFCCLTPPTVSLSGCAQRQPRLLRLRAMRWQTRTVEVSELLLYQVDPWCTVQLGRSGWGAGWKTDQFRCPRGSGHIFQTSVAQLEVSLAKSSTKPAQEHVLLFSQKIENGWAAW